jgi:hydrogenase maturation protease
MSERPAKVLLIGYGNPGRLDDGLGPALAHTIADLDLPGVTVESNYQLNVEDGAQAAEHDVIIFADAHVSCPEPFIFEPVEPGDEASFSSHSVEPAAVMALAQEMFGGGTRGFALGIRGHAFDAFGEALSAQAQFNLDAAISFLTPLLESRDITRFVNACTTSQTDESLPPQG